MKYYFFLGFLRLALACEKTEPPPRATPTTPTITTPETPVTPIDTGYAYPPQIVYDCIGIDTIAPNSAFPPDILGWEKTDISNNLNLHASCFLYFQDEKNGFQFCFDGTIQKTADGAQTWVEVYKNTTDLFQKCTFPSKDNGVVAALDLRSGTISFLMTYDGGNTWKKSTNTATEFYSVTEIQFPSPNLGFFLNSPYGLFKTIDSAQTWIPVLDEPNGYYIDKLFAQSSDTLYFCGLSSEVYRSTNGGQEWFPSTIPIAFASDVRFMDAYFGAVFSAKGVAVTHTAGNRWDLVSKRPTYFGRFFVDGSGVLYQTVKICNTPLSSSNSFQAFVTTNDFGATWKVGPLTRALGSKEQLFFINERCIIGLADDGKLYKWTRP